MDSNGHKSVLLNECLEGLRIKPEGVYLDGTLGGGGHSRRIAEKLTTGRLIGLDQDQTAITIASEVLADFPNVTIIRENYVNMPRVLDSLGIDGIDGILLDLGVSSFQLDQADRGFSYMADARLDARMDDRSTLDRKSVV